jgi:uncharacterized protein YhaN
MKVKDVQIDGFGVWTGLSVDSLSEGMTLFYGPNEAGKTTLMQFVRAMLYGFTEERREKYLPPVHGGTPGGAIRVTGPGGGYEIRRRSQLTDTGSTGQLSVTGQDGLSQGQHRLSSLLGQIDESIFTNVFAIGMRELQELSTLDDTAAADELYKLSSGLDRVSLVDVLRTLRDGREELIGNEASRDDADAAKLHNLIKKRENLRDEVQQLTRGGRRWSELASQRRAQDQEIEQLVERISGWEREARCVEIASGIFDKWQERDLLAESIEEMEEDTLLPEEAPSKLVQIDAMMEERQSRLEDVKSKRRGVREKAEQLPVSRRLLDMQGRIQAAAEQATWIEALEEQLERIDQRIERAQKQLESNADRLGMDADDREALLSGDLSQLPDLSKQTLSALSGPAKQVKEQTFLLKQARTDAATYKEKSDKLAESLQETLERANASNLQQAIRQNTELIATLRHRMQLGEHLEKLKRHYRDLEKETVDLTTAEALPVDRLVLLGVPFIVGGMGLIYGMANVFGFTWLVARPDPTWGMLCILFGFMSLLTYYFGRENGQRSTSRDREDCERQIDTLRRQLREVEAERNDIDSTLPSTNESLELRVRDTQNLITELEAALPTYHHHESALQSFKAAEERATAAVDGLRDAKRAWSATLDQLGLSDSMSPSSVRSLSDGYEAMQNSRRRLDELLSEKDQRRRERQAIAKRIESLYCELTSDDVPENGEQAEDSEDHAINRNQPHLSHNTPLEKLNHLQSELSRQHHWIKRRRALKEQDLQLKRQQSGHTRTIERGEQQRRALWAKCGVATPEQFYQMVDRKAQLVEMNRQYNDLESQIKSMIGNHVEYEDVESVMEEATATDLDRRWESLTTNINEIETRVGQLRTQQGQISQEMKQLGEDSRLTVAQLELGCIERQIEASARRWQTLSMASCLLEDVCSTFERERQPETLREASTFLNQLTDGKYTRVWTPLGTNQLKIGDSDNKSIPLEVLSRGTREAVFIALRLSLAAAYARRGVMLPLVLDDVLVNFDHDRAVCAAKTLQTFAELGHQVMMFTCHQHIVDIFHDIDAQVRMMPAQGTPGRATIVEPELEPEQEYEYEEAEEDEVSSEVAEDNTIEEPVAEEASPAAEQTVEEENVPPVESEPDRSVIYVQQPKRKAPRVEQIKVSDTEQPPASTLGWAWFEDESNDNSSVDRLDEVEDALASITGGQWRENDLLQSPDDVPEEIWNRSSSWWGDSRKDNPTQGNSFQ